MFLGKHSWSNVDCSKKLCKAVKIRQERNPYISKKTQSNYLSTNNAKPFQICRTLLDRSKRMSNFKQIFLIAYLQKELTNNKIL